MLAINRVLTPVRLIGMGIAFSALGLFVGYQSWDLDHRLPPADALSTVSGAIDSVHHRHGLELRLVGQPVPFRFPRSTQPAQQTAAALEQAVENRSRVELRYSPRFARTFTGEEHHLFYELRIDGRVVHGYAETRGAWRQTRLVGRTVAQIAAGLGIAFVVLAFRMVRATKSWTALDAPR
jgi:hypothetical protein